MARLYDLRAEYQRVIDSLPEDGSLSDEQAQQLRAIGGAVEDKVDQYRRWYKNLGSDKDALEHEIGELQRKLASVNKTREWVRLEIMDTLREMGCDRLDFAVGGVRLQENSIATLETDEYMMSDEWFGQVRTLNRQAVREAIEAGVSVPGASLVKHKHLRVT
jgi:chromosome segregation ATPase